MTDCLDRKGPFSYSQITLLFLDQKIVVEALESISTEELNLQNLAKSTQGNISLEEPKHQELIYSHQEVAYQLSVEQFTEGKSMIPIQVSGVPRGYELKLFPEEVSVHYVVSLDDFDLVDEQMFEAQVNYDWKNKIDDKTE